MASATHIGVDKNLSKFNSNCKAFISLSLLHPPLPARLFYDTSVFDHVICAAYL